MNYQITFQNYSNHVDCISKLVSLCSFHDDMMHSFSAVAPVCYAHLAATQMGQFMKFDEMSETSSSHGGASSAGNVVVPELPRLHEKVSSSMFFC